MKPYKIFSISFFLSAFNSSVLYAAIPLIVYFHTKSASLLALQFLIMAIASLLASFFVTRFNLFKTDKYNLISNELCLALFLFGCFLFNTESLVIVYIICFVEVFLSTCRAGYNESIIGDLISEQDNRQKIIGFTKSFGNIGSICGYSLSPILIHYFNISTLFLLLALSYFISGLSVFLIHSENDKATKKKATSPKFNLIFTGTVKMLSISHGLNAIALGILNATSIFVLKDYFSLSDYEVSLFLILSMFSALCGSIGITHYVKNKKFDHRKSYKLRMGYLLFFVLLSVADNKYFFASAILCLNLIHYFSIPIWQDMFQENTDSTEWKVVGSSRKTLVSIGLIIGSILGGIFINQFNHHITFAVAALFVSLSLYTLIRFINRKHVL